jgi:CDP-diacylglycerol--glycerol-3-phosphate 3-phosphatidyltransferase/cardiolipin synthase
MRSFIACIPSLLSGFRLLAAVAFPFCPELYWPWLIVVAAVSDVLDGWLARKWKVVSWQGGLIDAIADKLFVLTVLVVYAVAGKFSPLWIPAVIARDLLVLATFIYVILLRDWESLTRMQARLSGKLATGGQFVLFLVVAALPDATFHALLFASSCSVLAAGDYGLLFARTLRNRYRGNG